MKVREITNRQPECEWKTAIQLEATDLRAYLLARYGCRMSKKELAFEYKKCRATIDNKRNPRHSSYDPVLAEAEVKSGSPVGEKSVLFDTFKIAKILDGERAQRVGP
jgi:hypothetical protein